MGELDLHGGIQEYSALRLILVVPDQGWETSVLLRAINSLRAQNISEYSVRFSARTGHLLDLANLNHSGHKICSVLGKSEPLRAFCINVRRNIFCIK